MYVIMCYDKVTPLFFNPIIWQSTITSTLSSLKKVFITESARNKDKYHSSHTHSTHCCLQRWLPLSPRGLSGHRGDSEDWNRLWRRRKEWSGAPRPGPSHGGSGLGTPNNVISSRRRSKQSLREASTTYSIFCRMKWQIIKFYCHSI